MCLELTGIETFTVLAYALGWVVKICRDNLIGDISLDGTSLESTYFWCVCLQDLIGLNCTGDMH